MGIETDWYKKYCADHAHFIETDKKYKYLLENWKKLLVKEVDQERQIMERDKVIIALQDRVKKYESLSSTK